jgi:hypothetical protein
MWLIADAYDVLQVKHGLLVRNGAPEKRSASTRCEHEQAMKSSTYSPAMPPRKPLQDIERFWHSITGKAGLADYRPRDNRHTHASHLVSSGLSLENVGRLLGHTNPLTTKRYAHLADDPLRAAAERFGSKLRALQELPPAETIAIPLRPIIEHAAGQKAPAPSLADNSKPVDSGVNLS